jgi:hypothetical protein
MVRGSNPVGGEISRTHPDRPWSPPSLLTMGAGSFLGLKRPGRGVDHTLPSSTDVKRKSITIPLFLLWALVACFGVNCTFIFNTSLPLYQIDVGLCGAQSLAGHWGQEEFLLRPGNHPVTSTFTMVTELYQFFLYRYDGEYKKMGQL